MTPALSNADNSRAVNFGEFFMLRIFLCIEFVPFQLSNSPYPVCHKAQKIDHNGSLRSIKECTSKVPVTGQKVRHIEQQTNELSYLP